MWTIDRVKAELPTVTVRVDGKTKNARVTGGKLEFPLVRWEEANAVEVAWVTIVNCLNAGRPIRI